MRKILIVDDSKEYQQVWKMILSPQFEIIQAMNISDGRRKFFENNGNDLALVVMDACIESKSMDSAPLLAEIKGAFLGPIIACSSDEKYQRELVALGCTHQSDKKNVADMISQIMGIEN